MLQSKRDEAISFFHRAIATIPGKGRFKIMEVLIQDGSKDMIPLFIAGIKLEKNVLFAKSLLFLYGNLEHSEALIALLDIEDSMHFDLKKSYQKVASKLKSKFRELFYIDEFRNGDKNSKRMNHASEMMVKEPHPSYVPFLNEVAREGSLNLKKTACRTLIHLGDETSLDILLTETANYFHDRISFSGLARFLLYEKLYDKPKLADILGPLSKAGEWSEADCNRIEGDLRRGDTDYIMERIKATIVVEETLITKDILMFMQSFLRGTIPEKKDLKKLERLFDDHLESLTGLLQDAFAALGTIGHRISREGLLNEVEFLIPTDAKDNQELIATFLGGYKSEASRAKLLELLTPDQEVNLAQKVMAALEHYEFSDIPDELRALATNTENGLLRQRALDLLGHNQLLEPMIDELFAHSSTIVQVDGIQAMASYKVSAAHDRLLDMLHGDMPTRLQEVIISSLDAFPGEKTAEVIAPYMLMPHTYMIRYAAMQTLLHAGGERGVPLVLSNLEQYPDKNKPEIISSFLKTLAKDPNPAVFKHVAFWRDLLDEDFFERLRPQAISLVEGIDWETVDAEKWIAMLQEIVESPGTKRSSQENKTLRIMTLRARASLERTTTDKALSPTDAARKIDEVPEAAAEKPKVSKLEPLLKKLEGASLHDKMRTFRLLNLHLKPGDYCAGEPLSDLLVKHVKDIFLRNYGMEDLTKIALSLVAKIGNPELKGVAEKFVRDREPELLEFASKVLHLDAATPGKPVQSIIIVDDTVLIAKTLQKFLQKSGFDVVTENNPIESVRLMQNRRFDLLVLDLLMPQMNGFQLLNEVRKRRVDPPNTLIITSSREQQVLVSANKMEVQGILLKPFPIQKLLDRIQDLKV